MVSLNSLISGAPRLGRLTLVLTSLAIPSLAPAQDRDAEMAALRERVRVQEEQLRSMMDKIRVLEERMAPSAAVAPAGTAPAPAPKPPVVTATDRNFTLASADRDNFLRIRAVIHLDSRNYFDDGGVGNNDAFLIRRARMTFEGALNRMFQYQIQPEFGGSSAALNVANLTATLSPQLQVKFGRFKSTVGLEHQQSSSNAILFTERSLVTSLIGGTDIGVQLMGETPGGLIRYAAGVFNGTPDGTISTNTDTDDEKAVVGRLMFQPVEGLSVGVSGSYAARQEGAAGLPSAYRTEGQQRFFGYAAGTIADGELWRISPQGYYYHGSFGSMAEYAVSSTEIRSAGGVPATVDHKAWQLSLSYVLTGENATYAGVTPSKRFDPAAGTWGAFQVAARVSQLDIDDDVFPLFAAPGTNATQVDSFGLGLNWFMTNSVTVMVNYLQSSFDTEIAPTATLLRTGEKALFTRLQVVF